jgi:hypothetical protein
MRITSVDQPPRSRAGYLAKDVAQAARTQKFSATREATTTMINRSNQSQPGPVQR